MVTGGNLAGVWHDRIVKILKELCEEWVEKGKYKKVCDGNIYPLPLSYRKYVDLYRPDLYAVWSDTGKVDIYEVIDTETEGDALMDIIYSALTQNISNLCIVCSDHKKLENIKTHARIVLNKLLTEDKESLPNFDLRYFVYMPKEETVIKTIKKQLKEQLDF